LSACCGVGRTRKKPAPAAPTTGIETEAHAAYIVDFRTGAVLLDKNADERIPPASMSKMMTYYTVFSYLKDGKATLDDMLPVSEKAWRTQGSKMFVPLGGRVKIEDLLRGVIIQSGNDACIVLAEGLAGSEQAFVDEMNKKAQEIGLTGSHFTNVTGLPDPEHYMTARDLATLARHIIVEHGHHRVVIDPAADNAAAIRCYSKVGFRPVGIMRRYERGPDGTWHDGLLMDLLADELNEPGPGES